VEQFGALRELRAVRARERFGIAQDGDRGFELAALFGELFPARVRREADHFDAVREVPRDVERAGADGPGGAE